MKPELSWNRVLGAALICALATACGGSGGGAGDDDDDGSSDTTAPTIVSTSPTNGATGQYANVTVSITFSEPMNQASVENTLDATDLGNVLYMWNAAGDTLTIQPTNLLEYAEGIGADPAPVTASTYSVVLGNAAQDLAGNGLGTGTMITFSTLKSMTHVFDLDDVMTRSLSADASLFGDVDADLALGDKDDDDGVRALFTFDITMLPTSAVEVASATFATRQLPGNEIGLPYGDGNMDAGLGAAVVVDHVSYTALDNTAFNASQTAHASLGAFCVDSQVVIELDVTDAIENDRENRLARGDVSQFLLRFPLDNDGDGEFDGVMISRSLSELQVTYLAP